MSASRSNSSARPPRFSHRVQYLAFSLAMPLLGCLPRSFQEPLARSLSQIWYYVLPLRRGVVLENLARAFPGRSAAWRRKTARDCFVHFVHMMVFDSLAIRRKGVKALKRLVSEVRGLEHFEEAGGRRKSFILLSAHFGNWELGASYFAAVEKCAIRAVAKPMHNPLIENVLAQSRKACAWETISTRENPTPQIIRTIREKKILALLADQNAGKEGIFAPFFSELASTPAGPAILAYRFKLPLVFFSCRRSRSDGRYQARFYPPLYPDPDAGRQAEIERLTCAHVALLESSVREFPEQYFWFHRRWKTRPETESSD